MKSRWQRHKANVCGGPANQCWYCLNPPVGPSAELVKAGSRKIKLTRRGWKTIHNATMAALKESMEPQLIQVASPGDLARLSSRG